MKYLIFIFALISCASPLFAQQPSISYLMCDEAKSQLQIHGSFGKDSGSVSIEDTTLGIASWSDSLIICNLPDSGKGAGGHVVVENKNGKSNVRVLSIFRLRVDHPIWIVQTIAGDTFFWICPYTDRWIVNWRMDIATRAAGLQTLIRFEWSKSSIGSGETDGTLRLPWYDTSQSFNFGTSFWGEVDLNTNSINFGREKCKYGATDSIYTPFFVKFDSTGYITGYRDIHIVNPNDGYTDRQRTDSLYDQKILFPPSPKSIVIQQYQPTDSIIISHEDHSLFINSENPLGSTTASLYTIDGRLLKRTKLNISAPGNYSIDISDLHTHFAILVLQTSKGVITKKVIF